MLLYLLSTLLALTPHLLPVLSAPSPTPPSLITLRSPSRPRFCKNAPNHLAGTYFNPRSITTPLTNPHLTPRSPLPINPPVPNIPPTVHGTATPPMLWCAPHSQTTVLITLQVLTTDSNLITSFLNSAYSAVLAEIQHYGDGLVQSGAFSFTTAQPAAAAAAAGAGGSGSGATVHSTGEGASTSAAGAPEGAAPPPPGLQLHAWNENNHQMSWGVLGAAIQAVLDCMVNIREWGTASFSIWDGDTEVGFGVLGELGEK